MIRILFTLVAFAVMTCVCMAEPVQLACTGKMEATTRGVNEDYTIAITIDLAGRNVTVGSYGSAPISGNAESDTVVFMASKGAGPGLSTGTVNRLTGVASVHIVTLTDGLYKFYGMCKPAQKLF